ncbi:MAG: selenocysteine-specific translation elongation factor [Candidatus Marinimicrobia bacterium]|nr:selenocysteine-specific translation elongation factor [Candidatus Neomarinimicrobiota bacterium]
MSLIDQNIIGLSGHIDHGKTSIVKALTGQNTDSSKEEFARGMTINIGFAFLNEKITLIDVPGHERFIKNMVAGVNSIDYALLVIAADDGIMPQTIEHFEILKLFNIQDGAIVINKIDTVKEDWLELVLDEVKIFVKGSFLEKKEIYKVSALNYDGINFLKEDLINYQYKKHRVDKGIFRVFVDRVFTSKGFGSVITGTITSGEVKIGDKLKILPQNKEIKVRGLETHKVKKDQLEIGNRAAINIQTNEKVLIERGNHISDIDYFSTYESAIVSINILTKAKNGIKNNERLRIYCGTQEVMSRVLLFNENNIEPGKSSGAILKFEKPIVISIDDPFIIRKYSPLITVGGGKILELNIFKKWKDNKQYVNEIYNKKDQSDRLSIIISNKKNNPFTYNTLSKYLNVSEKYLKILLKESKNIKIIENNWIVLDSQFEEIKHVIINYFNDFHIANPYRKGVIKEEILNFINIDNHFLDIILEHMLNDKLLKYINNNWSKFDFDISLTDNEKKINQEIIDLINQSELNAISINEVFDTFLQYDKNIIKKILDIEIDSNSIIILNGNLLFSQKNINKLIQLVKNYFKVNNSLDVSSFKNITKTSRKYAVPLLEYLDKINVTCRIGNERKLYG